MEVFSLIATLNSVAWLKEGLSVFLFDVTVRTLRTNLNLYFQCIKFYISRFTEDLIVKQA